MGTILENSPAAAQGMNVTVDTIPTAARISINDLLENGAHIKPGQKVLLIAYLDGLYGGDNLVDREAIQWIQRAIQERGNQVEVLWVDEPSRPHAWKFPDYVRTAMERNDVTINHSFDLTTEELIAFRSFLRHRVLVEHKMAPFVRNFATTAPLLCSSWALTPHELVGEIRVQAALMVKPGEKYKLTDPNGSHLEGVILPSPVPEMVYGTRREVGYYLPWPEWVVPPIAIGETSGIFVFDRTLPWWSRYIGIPPVFAKPVTLTIKDARIVKIEGGDEAEAIRRFMAEMKERCGESAYYFDQLHWGVHPQARISPQQCPSILYRRLIDHCHSSNFHVHVGSPEANAKYPYWAHFTGDVRNATFAIGEQMVYKDGHLTALDHPKVLEVAARYPGRPGLDQEPFQG